MPGSNTQTLKSSAAIIAEGPPALDLAPPVCYNMGVRRRSRHRSQDMETISKIRPIWLVQRAGIPTPLADTSSTLTNSLNLEYMGSAEFEFGALPKSLRHLRSAHEQGDMVIRLVPDIQQGESPLRVLSTLDDATFADYTKELHRLRYHNPPTKENTYFQFDLQRRYPGFSPGTELWWDLSNDTMWSFNKRYMNRLVSYLENSFKVLSEGRK